MEVYGEGVGDGAEGGFVVCFGKLGVFDAFYAFAEGFDERGGGSFGAVGVVGCFEAVKDKHGRDHVLESRLIYIKIWRSQCGVSKGRAYLYAVVSICKVVHGLQLLIDDSYTCLMRTNSDIFNVFSRFPALFQLSMDMLSSFDCCL